MRIIYADELFIENAAIDYVLLLVTAKITAVPMKRRMAVLASVLGGAYAVAAALGAGVLVTAAFKVAVGALMVFLVFGRSEHFVRVLLVFFAVSAAFAGAVMAAVMATGGTVGRGILCGDVTFKVLLLSFLVCWAVFTAVFRQTVRHRVAREIETVTIRAGGRSVTVPALIDTGNSLTDPLTGLPVTVAGLDAIAGLFDAGTLALLREGRDAADTVRRLGGVRGGIAFTLVPFSAVGTGRGMLPAFRAELVRGGKTEKGVVAIAAGPIGEGRGYAALSGAG